jgi:cytoskeletal protein CcmA (bactofilin family)
MQPSEYSVPVPSDRQAILCLHCGKPQEVGRKAMSVTCKFCSKPLKIEDVKIARYEARRVIEACGTVTIDKKGHVVSDIRCVNLQLKGKLKGDVVGLSKVEVAADAELKGDVTAGSLNVASGAMLDGYYRIGQRNNGEETPKASDEGKSAEVVKQEAPVPQEQAAPTVIKVPVRKSVVPIRRH